jgi:hypothetical protein
VTAPPGGAQVEVAQPAGQLAEPQFTSGRPEQIEYRPQFFDIAAGQRIVLVDEQFLNGGRRSVSVATAKLTPEPSFTYGKARRLGLRISKLPILLARLSGDHEF